MKRDLRFWITVLAIACATFAVVIANVRRVSAEQRAADYRDALGNFQISCVPLDGKAREVARMICLDMKTGQEIGIGFSQPVRSEGDEQ